MKTITITIIFCAFSIVTLMAGTFNRVPDSTAPGGKIINGCLGDLDGDGKPELVMAAWNNPDKVLIFKNDNGSFGKTPWKIIELAKPNGCMIDDFDKDGKNDLAVSIHKGGVVILWGKDDLSKEKSFKHINGQQRLHSALTGGHLNKKGLYYFLVGPVLRKLSKSKDVFLCRSGYIYPPSKSPHNGVTAIADINADGNNDIVAISTDRKQTSFYLRIYYGPITSTMLKPKYVAEFTEIKLPAKPRSFAVGDINNDGRQDIVVSGSGKTFVYLQNAPAGFNSDDKPASSIDNSGIVVLEDLNNDSKVDLVIGDKTKKKIFIYLNSDKGINPSPSQIIKQRMNGLRIADINDDGLNDIVTLSYRHGAYIYLNTGGKDAAVSDEKIKTVAVEPAKK